MKKILFLIAFLAISVASFSQTVTGSMSDLNGAVTVYSDSLQNARTVTLLCTETGGTSDGSLYYQVSTDGINFVTVSETAGLFHFYPNDTLTITDGAVWSIQDNSAFPYSRIMGTGTSGDSTQVDIEYRRGIKQ